MRRYNLEDGDAVRRGNTDLVVLKNLATDTVEFCLNDPAEAPCVYIDPVTEREYPIQWEDGVPFVEVPEKA